MDTSAATKYLIEQGLEHIRESYGPRSAYPQAYHNAEHAEDVMNATKLIAAEAAIQDKIPTNYVDLLVLAACYHDAVHKHPANDGQDETASAQMIADKMHATGAFAEEHIAIVGTAIMATRWRIDSNTIRQAVSDDYTTLILADADLASVGRPFDTFWDRSLKLKQEQGNTQSDPDYIAAQLTFLRNYRFLTPEAEEHFPHRAANIQHLEELLASRS